MKKLTDMVLMGEPSTGLGLLLCKEFIEKWVVKYGLRVKLERKYFPFYPFDSIMKVKSVIEDYEL